MIFGIFNVHKNRSEDFNKLVLSQKVKLNLTCLLALICIDQNRKKDKLIGL